MLDTYRGSCLRTLLPLEEQVSGIFMKFSFKKFEEQFERATLYKVLKLTQVTFKVKYYKHSHTQNHVVIWENDVGSCSCKNFEFRGIICRHILSVFLYEDCFRISVTYLPLHWCRDEF